MDGFITHCGAAEVTREEAFAVPVPEYTRTHRPVPYEDLTLFVEKQIQQLGARIETSAYALNRKGQHFFAKYCLVVDEYDADMALSVVFRQSYDKQFRLGIAFGGLTRICDNLLISGDHFQVMHKNTMNGWDTFRKECLWQASESTPLQAYWGARQQLSDWGQIALSEREGYRILGELMGYDKLTPHQASVAFEDWHKPRHEEFEERTFRNLYQCVTEGLKKGPIANLPERHIEAHRYLKAMQIQG